MKAGAEPEEQTIKESFFTEEIINSILSLECELVSPNFDGLVPFFYYDDSAPKFKDKDHKEKEYDDAGYPIIDPRFVLNSDFEHWINKM